MRLNLHEHDQEDDPQKNYGDLTLAIGEGYHLNKDADLQSENNQTGEQIYILNNINYVLTEDEAINFIYPEGVINQENIISRALLAVTNKEVDHWNERMQELNLNQMEHLYSKDKLSEVDDPHNILSAMLTEDILHKFNNNSVPPHELKLKCGDICIITRNIAKKEGLTNNTRVTITRIQQYCITVYLFFNFKYIFFLKLSYFRYKLLD